MIPINSRSTRWLYVTFLSAAFVLATFAAVSAIFKIPMSELTRDVTVIAKIHPLSGALSSLGILLWCATASICLFSAVALRSVVSSDIYRFLLASALLSMYLLFDDLFMFHETLAPNVLGVDQRVVILILGLAISSYLIVFRSVILRTNYVFLLTALGLLTLSVAIDVIPWQWMSGLGHWVYLFEDGPKWLGIACWCGYISHASLHWVVGNLSQPNDAMQLDARTPQL